VSGFYISAELQLKREHLPVIQLKEWEHQVRALTDLENAANEIPKLCWRRDVRLGVKHELRTVRAVLFYTNFQMTVSLDIVGWDIIDSIHWII